MVVDYRRSLLGAVPDGYIGAYAGDAYAAEVYAGELAERLAERRPPTDISARELRVLMPSPLRVIPVVALGADELVALRTVRKVLLDRSGRLELSSCRIRRGLDPVALVFDEGLLRLCASLCAAGEQA